jgi:glucose-1-phosphate adenylyltransferase
VLSGNYQSLLDHLGSGKDWDLSRKYGGLRLLPPFSLERSGAAREFRGKMDALAGVRSYLEEIRQSHVVLADSDVIINIPLQEVYQAHLNSGADITAVCTSDLEDAPDELATYFRLDEESRVKETLINLRNTAGCYRSLEIYILSKQLLLELVDACASHDQVSFRTDVLQAQGYKLDIRGYVWNGYAAQIHSLQSYYERSMELLDPKVRRELFCPARPIHTKERNDASTYIDPDSTCRDSFVADGCTIEGNVEHSILFHGVSVARGANVKNCILMQDVTIHKNASLTHVVADKKVSVMEDRTLMGHDSYPLVISKGSQV